MRLLSLDAITWQNNMEKFVHRLRQEYGDITFEVADTFCWHSDSRKITYKITGKDSDIWSTLHELGHSLLDHTDYGSDSDLIQKELAAWDKAVQLARDFDIVIDQDHVEDCLDSYRDWAHRRSSCPVCSLQGIQKPSGSYYCLNCSHIWSVSRERLCRPYRRLIAK